MVLDDDQFWAFCNLGYLFYRRGQPARGAKIFRGLTALYPNEPYPWIGLGACRRALGRAQASAEAYQKAMEAKPDSVRARVALAELLHEHGADADARTILLHLRESPPDDQLVRRAQSLLQRWSSD